MKNKTSNKSFGYFFSFVLLISYLIFKSTWLFFASAFLLLISLTFSNLLAPLNKLWFKFGELLGIIVSPLVLGIIFFILLTPIAILSKTFGRNILNIRLESKIKSYWIIRDKGFEKNDFDNQY